MAFLITLSKPSTHNHPSAVTDRIAAVSPIAAGDGGIPIAALAPFVLLVVAFVGYCLLDLSRNEVRYLPKWAWAIVCVISVPAGGIVYLIVGRRPR